MIVDSIKNLDKYSSLDIKAKEILDFISKADKLDDGKYEILGEDLFALVQTYKTKNEDECRLEAHNKYIDVQYLYKGIEAMDYKLREKLTVQEDLLDTNDVVFYENAKEYTRVVVEEGSFALFMPEDGHRPGMKYDESIEVRKIVFKIKIK